MCTCHLNNESIKETEISYITLYNSTIISTEEVKKLIKTDKVEFDERVAFDLSK